jgi:F0F1-type ATP synthase assembly protein I
MNSFSTLSKEIMDFIKSFYCSGPFISGIGLGFVLQWYLAQKSGVGNCWEFNIVGLLLMCVGGNIFRRRINK